MDSNVSTRLLGLSVVLLLAISCSSPRQNPAGVGGGIDGGTDVKASGGRGGSGSGGRGGEIAAGGGATGSAGETQVGTGGLAGGDGGGGSLGSGGAPMMDGGSALDAPQADAGVTCGAQEKLCGGVCVAISDPAYGCGATTCDASTCPSPGTGGTVVCQAGACVVGTCPANFKKCGNKCASVTDPTYGCGATSCDATGCPAAGTGTLVCQAGACVVGTCGAGTKKCGDKCVTTDANNGCADAARCTACANNETCMGSPTTCQCVPTAMATACNGKCGMVPNGCGGMYTCAGCSGSTPDCVNNKCVCTPKTTAQACINGQNCGTAPDGCGNNIPCGTCGGSTPNCVNNKCVCTPKTTAQACINGQNCGTAPDGCGNNIPCGTCSGSTPDCVSNKCACTPKTMQTACSGKSCGTVSDGCTGSYLCGTCNGTIPACKNGTSCVECTADSNCTPLGYKTCDQSQNSCVCAQKSSSNRITNGGFDDSGLSGWGYDAMVVKWDGSDNDNCPRSGSVKIGSGSANLGQLTQCVSVGNGGGKVFTLGFKYKQDTASTAFCLVSYATGIDATGSCINGAGPDFFGVQGGVGISTTNWQSASGSGTSDPGTTYIQIQCQPTNGGNMWLDQMYLVQGSSGSF